MSGKPAYIIQDHERPDTFTVRRITYRQRHDVKAPAQRPKTAIKVNKGMGRFWMVGRVWCGDQPRILPHKISRTPGRWV